MACNSNCMRFICQQLTASFRFISYFKVIAQICENSNKQCARMFHVKHSLYLFFAAQNANIAKAVENVFSYAIISLCYQEEKTKWVKQ